MMGCWPQPQEMLLGATWSQVLPCQLHPVKATIHLPDCPLAQKGTVTGPCSPKHHQPFISA